MTATENNLSGSKQNPHPGPVSDKPTMEHTNVATGKKKEVPADTPKKAPWDDKDGDMSEVVDSEGHRVHINHY